MGVSPKWTALGGGGGGGGGGSSRRRQQQQQQQHQQHQPLERKLRRQRREQQQQQQRGGKEDVDDEDEEGHGRRRRCHVVKAVVAAAAAAAGQASSWWLDVEASALSAATTSAAVMAPALTEGGPQKPEHLIPTTLPAGGFLTAEQAKQVCHTASSSVSLHPSAITPRAGDQAKTVCQNREVLAQFVVSANVQPSKIDDQCLHGIPKDLIDDVINFKFGNGLDGLPDLIDRPLPRKEAREASSDAAIMNDPSMGDPADSMCYYNTVMGPGEAEESCGIADVAGDAASVAQDSDIVINDTTAANDDRQIDEDGSIDQIMGFTDINVQAGVLGQNNDDEILQVINSMNNVEGAEEMLGGDSRLIDGCGGLVEGVVSSQSTSEGVSEIFPDGETFPLNLLNEVDMLSLYNDNMSDNGVVVNQHQVLSQQQLILQQQQQQEEEAVKLAELERHQEVVERRQHELERRTDFLLRRLRKLQSQLMGEHATEEVGHVLELAQKSAKKCLYQDLASLGQKAGAGNVIGNARNFPEIAGSVSSFLQKVQKSCNAQSNSIAVRQRNSCRYFGAGSRDNYVNSNVNRMPAFGVPQIKIDGDSVEKVMGPMSTKLKVLQSAYDSDCTASSSGGESCDEMQTFNNPHQQQLPIAKRAGWRYAQERASVASRWTWLQAQISDLEFKIRQYTELQKQIRLAKGHVMLENSPTTTTTTTTTSLTSLGVPTSSASTSPSSFGPESTLNGYSGILPSSTLGRSCALEASNDMAGSNFGASRCRPFVRQAFRKRKLLQLDGLHLHSKKAARPTNVRCDCDGRLAPCALCTGRRDPAAGQDAELLSTPERLALIYPGYHPVLSMPDEVPLSAHINAILRSPEWQQKMVRGGVRVSKLKDKDGNERRNRRVSEHRTKCPPRLKKPQTATISTSIKRKLLKGKRSRNNSERTNNSGISRKRTTKQTQQQQQQQPPSQPQPQPQTQQSPLLQLDEEEEAASVLSSSSKYSSPVPSPLLLHHHQQQPPTLQQQSSGAGQTAAIAQPPPEKITLKEKSSNSHSRLRQNSYDIDNIVIPYSVASSTRLEKLPYKEIPIPKWRRCNEPSPSDVKNGAMQKSTSDSDVEDVSEEAVALRHERSEREEAKRFLNFMALPHSSRVRRDRRLDCRSESGANTPDPMSPHASDCGGDTMSPITSPPPTPSNVQDTEHMLHSDAGHHRSSSLQNALRRKIPTRSQREEIVSVVNEEEIVQQVLPYDPRTFPLTDEDYDKMLEAMPEEHLQSTSLPVCPPNEEKLDEREADSQESDSTESALCELEGEDPNDPEWTVAEAREMEKERIRPTVKR